MYTMTLSHRCACKRTKTHTHTHMHMRHYYAALSRIPWLMIEWDIIHSSVSLFGCGWAGHECNEICYNLGLNHFLPPGARPESPGQTHTHTHTHTHTWTGAPLLCFFFALFRMRRDTFDPWLKAETPRSQACAPRYLSWCNLLCFGLQDVGGMLLFDLYCVYPHGVHMFV